MSAIRLSDLPPSVRRRVLAQHPELSAAAPKRQKFNAKATTGDDGEKFDSLKEQTRYHQLVYLAKARAIQNLQRQPQFYITRDGVVIATYRADFRYQPWGSRDWIVEDVKGGKATRTEAYQLRKKLVEAQHGIEIQEV